MAGTRSDSIPRARLVPIRLGCCPPEGRACALCGPSPPAPDASLIQALLTSYAADGPAGADLEPSFIGGAPPTDEQITAIGGRRFRVRVRPDLLSRARVATLISQGCDAIELDALSVNDRLLAWAGRPYRGALVREMCASLGDMGVRVGVTLAVGLPAGTATDTLDDARTLGPLIDTARVHPVLVFAGARLAEAWRAGRYRPLTQREAVTRCVPVLDALEEHGVEVLRVGQQPGPDGLGRLLAGPHEPGFRDHVESARLLVRLRALCATAPPNSAITVCCAPRDESRVRGPQSSNLRELRAHHAPATLSVRTDPALERGQLDVRFTAAPDEV